MNLFISALLWVAGLVMAGSDSPYMPWLNGLGIVVFFYASFMIIRVAERRKERLKNMRGD